MVEFMSFLVILVITIAGAGLGYRWGIDRRKEQSAVEGTTILGGAIGFVLSLAICLIAARAAHLYTDWLWFTEVGQVQVWLTRMLMPLAFFAVGGSITLVAAIINYRMSRFLFLLPPGKGWNAEEDWNNTKIAIRICVWITAIAAILFFGALAGAGWDETLKFINQMNFGTTDPIHGLDISFYVFSLPFYDFVLRWFQILSLMVFTGVAALYVLVYDSAREHCGEADVKQVESKVIGHVSLTLAVFFLAMAADNILCQFRVLVNGHAGVIAGPGFVDIHYRLGGYQWVVAAFLAAALILAINYLARKWGAIAGALVIPLVVWSVAMVLVPEWNQFFNIKRSQITMETPYIQYQIQGTRQAFGLVDIEENQFPYVSKLNTGELKENDDILSAARVMDWRPLLDASDTLQEIRQYYDFGDVDIDRYGDKPVMLSARELNQSQLPTDARGSWSNVHLQYTHGYGYVVADVNRVDTGGLPSYLVKNIPPVGPEDLLASRPEIYFGEQTTSWIFVGTSLKEFGRPTVTTPEYVHYEGRAGIPIGGFFRKAAIAIRFNDLTILLTEFVKPDSRLIFRRTLEQRVKSITPFLKYDYDPYLVIGDDRLWWIWDAYTTTDMYPYATKTKDLNYIRNSVKIIIDAYDGTVTFYIADEKDPLVKTWAGIFPTLFRPLGEMPDFLKAHLRYPEDLFKIQAHTLATYHMQDPTVFFNREDLWAIPQEIFYLDKKPVEMEPRYVMATLPGQRQEEYLLITPFTPANKQNMIAWLAARMDGANYGKLALYQFPRDQLIMGPLQIEAMINQDPKISGEVTLWSQRGSQVLWGNQIVLPIISGSKGSVVYIKPLYLLAQHGKIPALTRVILVHGDRIIEESTLQEALVKLYAESTKVTIPAPAVGPTTPAPSLKIDLRGFSRKELLELMRQIIDLLDQTP